MNSFSACCATSSPETENKGLIEGDPDPEAAKESTTSPRLRFGACICAGVCCFLVVIHFVLTIFVAVLATKGLATLGFSENHQVYFNKTLSDGSTVLEEKNPQDVDTYEWWPGCTGGPLATTSGPTEELTNCGSECCPCSERDRFREYNSQAEYKDVSFTSRKGDGNQETVKLTAWWLPANSTADADSAIIIVHGMMGTRNDGRVAQAAYLARTAGFPVLMLNLRGHGSSDYPEDGKQTWGWDYPYDVLGAWDYLVNDPDGQLGGKRSPSKIGMMGFSMGGFAAACAFGMEPEAAALWIDGASSHPRDSLNAMLAGMIPVVGSAVAATIVPQAYALTELMSGVDLDYHSPENTLPTGPETQRPVMVVSSPDDSTAPMWMYEKYANLFSEYDSRYKLETWSDSGGVCTEAGSHNVLQWLHPAAYRELICQFFSEHLLHQSCDSDTLPDDGEVHA